MPERKPSEDFMTSSLGGTRGRALSADVHSLTDRYGRFTAQPFERGFGTTIGNSLRRALLMSIEGAAITAIRIEGVMHEFATMPGVAEDVTDVILNIKQIPFKLHGSQPKTLRISKNRPGEVTAADIQADSDVEILDTSVHIVTLQEAGLLNVEMRLKHGRGYVPAERNFDEGLGVGYIPIDSVHTPIKKVNYTVEPVRTGEYTEEFEQVTIEVWTDGSITPEKAIGVAAKVIRDRLLVFSDIEQSIDFDPDLPELVDDPGLPESFNALVRELKALTLDVELINKKADVEHEKTSAEPIHQLDQSIDELPLSVRAYNTLKNADIRTVRDIARHTEQELSAKNFGKKSIEEIREILNDLGLDYGMTLAKPAPTFVEDWETKPAQEQGAHARRAEDLELPDELKALLPAVRVEMHEEATARKYVTERYRSLVDLKYANGLSTDETDELERLKTTLDSMDQPYYDAIIKRLRNLIEQKEVAWRTLSDHLEAQQ